MYFKNFMIFFVFLVCTVLAANKLSPQQLISSILIDDVQVVRLADQQKLVIPLNGRTISTQIQYFPSNKGQCEFVNPAIESRAIAQSKSIFQQKQQIVSILPLINHEIAFIADPYFNVAVYSIDQHSLLKNLAPKRNLKPERLMKQIVQPLLVASEDQQLIYYLIPDEGFVFEPNTLSSQVSKFSLGGNLKNIIKGIPFKNYIIVGCSNEDINIYEINRKTKFLNLIQTIRDDKSGLRQNLMDLEFDKDRKLLYALYEKKIQVYKVSQPNFYNEDAAAHKIIRLQDTIQLQNITYHENTDTDGLNYNLEISRLRSEQSIFILFKHRSRNIVAELNYRPTSQQFLFVRYYKFSMQISEIHAVKDVLLVVGNGILGIFPFAIDPRLIKEQFNGFMILSNIEKLVVIDIPFFLASTKNTIQYGEIYFGFTGGLHCKINQTSQIKSIKFKANLTTCSIEQPQSVDKYCQYQKTFILEPMEYTASAPIADSIWIGIIVLTILFVIGICTMFFMQKRKERQIKRLQLYFEEKKRKLVPPTSQRGNHRFVL